MTKKKLPDVMDLEDFKKATRPLEHDEQVLLIQWRDFNLSICPALRWLHAIPNGAKLPYTKDANGKKKGSRQGAKLKAEGLSPGVPDLSLPVPRKGYHGAYAEMKRVDGDPPSDDQKEWLDYLESAGYFVGVMCGAEEAINFFAGYLDLELDPLTSNGAGLFASRDE